MSRAPGPRIAVVTRLEGPADLATLQLLLDLTTLINVRWLHAHPEAPELYASGVRYAREPRFSSDTACQEERFLTLPSLLLQGCGDCDDLAPALAAELTVRHQCPARAVPYPTSRGYHVVVIDAFGVLHDPSRVLGMGAPWPC